MTLVETLGVTFGEALGEALCVTLGETLAEALGVLGEALGVALGSPLVCGGSGRVVDFFRFLVAASSCSLDVRRSFCSLRVEFAG